MSRYSVVGAWGTQNRLRTTGLIHDKADGQAVNMLHISFV